MAILDIKDLWNSIRKLLFINFVIIIIVLKLTGIYVKGNLERTTTYIIKTSHCQEKAINMLSV